MKAASLNPILRRLCQSLTAILLLPMANLLAADELKQAVDAQVAPYIRHEVVSGLAVGVYRDGQSLSVGYGKVAGPESATPDGKTVFEIGSISKVFTGILLADAVLQQPPLIRLDQPIQGMLPAGVVLPIKDEVPITFRHLSTHTSGLPRLPANMQPRDGENPYADYTAEPMYEFLGKVSLERKPLEKLEYSNFAVGLLGQLLATANQTTYASLLDARICDPLGMTDTVIELRDPLRERLARPHYSHGRPAKNWDLAAMVGAGGIRSTTEDMLRFIKANVVPPQDRLGKAIDLAWQVQQEPLEKGDFAMGLGWHIARDGSTRWHNGQTGGYHSMLLVNRQLKIGVVVLSNTATPEVDRLAEDLVRKLAGAPVAPREFSSDLLEKLKKLKNSSETPAKTPVVKVAPEILERYVGEYQLVPGFILTVTRKEGELFVGATGQPTFQVYPKSEQEWFYKVVEATLTFAVDEAGKCSELDLFQGGIHQKARRIQQP